MAQSSAGPLRVCLVNAVNPPGASSRGERWANLAAALAQTGCEVTIVRTVLPPGFWETDPGLESIQARAGVRFIDIDGGIFPQLAYPQPRAGSMALAKRLAAELPWPDPWLSFSRRAARWVRGHASRFDVVISSGRPWSDHLAGYEVARTTGLPWVADYGDPWTLVHESGEWKRTRDFRLERLLLAHCSLVLVTTPQTKELFAAAFEIAPERILVLPVGADPPMPPPPAGGAVRLVHAGMVYDPRASITPFLRAFAAARATAPMRLDWFGDVRRPAELALLRDVADRYSERASLAEIVAVERASHVVVVFGNHGGTQLPAKLWRVLATGRLVFAVAADAHDPLLEIPEVRAAGAIVENTEAQIGEGLRQLIARLPTWEWEPPSLPKWTDRAEALAYAVRSIPCLSGKRAPAASAIATAATVALLKLPEILRKIRRHRSSRAEVP
jgi:hypothetical protein